MFIDTCTEPTERGERTIALSAILLKPTNNAKEVSFFPLGVLDFMLERV